MHDLPKQLARFIPHRLLCDLSCGSQSELKPDGQNFDAAVLFLDISGFTPLAEQLHKEGNSGTEQLSHILNDYFGKMLVCINQHGGDVAKFAGDALLAFWPADNESLRETTLRAVACALEILATLNNHLVQDDITLSLKAGLAAGAISALRIGGVRNRWEYVLLGNTLKEMGAAEKSARVGELHIAANSWPLIAHDCDAQVDAAGNIHILGQRTSLTIANLLTPVNLSEQIIEQLYAFIPFAVRERFSAGQSDWISELRRVSVIFVQIDFEQEKQSNLLPLVQQLLEEIQQLIYQFEGALRQFIVDDKGLVCIVVFGLPPFVHQEDPIFAVRAAQALHRMLDKLGYQSSIGVSTGSVFCGVVGNDLRCEYAMVGDTINLSARLMSASDHAILCDQATYQSASKQFVFQSLPSLSLKGKQGLTLVYQPKEEMLHQTEQFETHLIGRKSECKQLFNLLDRLSHHAQSNCVYIEGEAGIGKSRLNNAVVQQALNKGMTVLQGRSDPLGKLSSYHVWKPVFMEILALDKHLDQESLVSRIRHLLTEKNQWRERLPLLNPILPFAFAETSTTQSWTGSVRADNTRRFMIDLITAYVGEQSLLLTLEDAHWFDSASWDLLVSVEKSLNQALLMVTSRQVDAQWSKSVHSFIDQAISIRLGGLSDNDISTLLFSLWQAKEIEPKLRCFISEKSRGNPYFVEEIGLTLKNSGSIQLSPSGVIEPLGNLDTLAIPETIQGIITARIDGLSVDEQLTIKSASVIGYVFPLALLCDIYPLPNMRTMIPQLLASLNQLHITLQVEQEPNAMFSFRHLVMRDVVYDLMLFKQRRCLHQAIAKWYESIAQVANYPLLAYHLKKSGETTRAIYYLEKAAENAIHEFANSEAIALLHEAMALSAKSGLNPEPLQQANWERWLGYARLYMGGEAHAREHFKKALSLMGFAFARNQWSLYWGITKELFKQAMFRFFSKQNREQDPVKIARLVDASRAYEKIMEISQLANDTLSLVYANLRALNLAEQAGSDPERARGYASLSIGFGFGGMHTLATYYSRLAWQIAKAIQDKPSMAWVLEVDGIYGNIFCRWASAQKALRQAINLSQESGDRWREMECTGLLAEGLVFNGRIDSALEQYEQLIELSKDTSVFLYLAWGMSGKSSIMLYQGEIKEAWQLCSKGAQLLEQSENNLPRLLWQAVDVIYHRFCQQPERACQLALQTIPELSAIRFPANYYIIDICSMLAGSARDLLTRSEEQQQLEVLIKECSRLLKRFGQSFPTGKPRWMLNEGSEFLRLGKIKEAYQCWHKGLIWSLSLNMPLEEAWLRYKIAQHKLGPSPDKEAQKAEVIFNARQIRFRDYDSLLFEDI